MTVSNIPWNISVSGDIILVISKKLKWSPFYIKNSWCIHNNIMKHSLSMEYGALILENKIKEIK